MTASDTVPVTCEDVRICMDALICGGQRFQACDSAPDTPQAFSSSAPRRHLTGAALSLTGQPLHLWCARPPRVSESGHGPWPISGALNSNGLPATRSKSKYKECLDKYVQIQRTCKDSCSWGTDEVQFTVALRGAGNNRDWAYSRNLERIR